MGAALVPRLSRAALHEDTGVIGDIDMYARLNGKRVAGFYNKIAGNRIGFTRQHGAFVSAAQGRCIADGLRGQRFRLFDVPAFRPTIFYNCSAA